MVLCDNHTHTVFSFDGGKSSTPDAMCEAAIAKGVKCLALTDHHDINTLFDHSFPPYLADDAKEAIVAAQKKYAGKLVLSYGIELGQATQYPDASQDFIDRYNPETVVCSLHNARGKTDYSLIDMTKMTFDDFREMWDEYLVQMLEMLDFAHADIMAHLTYPVRYAYRAGHNFDISYSYNMIEKICKKLVSKNICMELNTSGYRQKEYNRSHPDSDILKIYHECGGSLVTLGSDAHFPQDIAAGFERACAELSAIGINQTAFVRNNNIETYNI